MIDGKDQCGKVYVYTCHKMVHPIISYETSYYTLFCNHEFSKLGAYYMIHFTNYIFLHKSVFLLLFLMFVYFLIFKILYLSLSQEVFQIHNSNAIGKIEVNFFTSLPHVDIQRANIKLVEKTRQRKIKHPTLNLSYADFLHDNIERLFANENPLKRALIITCLAVRRPLILSRPNPDKIDGI